MRRAQFYITVSGRCPVREHLDTLPDKAARKIAWVLRAVRDLERVPTNYLKKLVSTDNIWEVRVDVGGNSFRLLGFFHGQELIILTNSFQKKSQKTPRGEIRLAEERKTDYLKRRKNNG
ncbi:MAG: type II toxin-antitoxin system RelE/ParE family toxin [Verrucomicrobia bacterium]|jgi:phage-related protein|nr:type II toxin-antitoxin system RelE/ParE family toxin [Verrucomicrobiota bacterium]